VASVIQVGEKWRALVRRKGFKTQCKTFAKKAQADAWAAQVEADMYAGVHNPGVLQTRYTVKQLCAIYLEMRAQSGRPVSSQSNEHYLIRRLDTELGHYLALALSPDILVGYCRSRVDDGVSPATINTEISKLSTVLRYAGAAKNLVMPDVVKAARPLLQHLKLVGTAPARDRRPEEDELVRVLGQLRLTFDQVYGDAVEFAVYTAMRRGEVCKVLRADVDVEKRLVLIRDRKHPRSKKGNDQWVPLLGKAWDIAQARLQLVDDGDGRLFPVAPGTLSKNWLMACRMQGIENLRLHDMRHEGTSQLFEDGYTIPQVALVTGHKDWRNLKRYTNLRPEDLHKIAAAKKPAKKKASKSPAKRAVFRPEAQSEP